MNILVTDSNFKHSLGIIRSLGKQNFKPYILSFKRNSLCSFSKFSKKEILVPKYNSNKFNNHFFYKLKKYKIDFIILVGTNSFKKIVPLKQKLLKIGVKIITTDIDTLNIALSKKKIYNIAEKLSIPYPKTFYINKISDIENISNKISYPCVIKGLYEVGKNIVDYANNKQELFNKYIKICELYNFNNKNNFPLIQEYITGFGCGFFAIYNKGKCGITFQHKRIRELPVTGGSSVSAESYKNILLEKYGKRLLDYLNWHGVAMIEYKMNTNNTPILMEINPKFWDSTDLALESGVNFPKELIKIYNNQDIKYSNKYKYPSKYHWPISGEFFHLFNKPSNIINILFDTFNPNIKSNIWLSDFKPTINMLYTLFKDIIKILINKFKKF